MLIGELGVAKERAKRRGEAGQERQVKKRGKGTGGTTAGFLFILGHLSWGVAFANRRVGSCQRRGEEVRGSGARAPDLSGPKCGARLSKGRAFSSLITRAGGCPDSEGKATASKTRGPTGHGQETTRRRTQKHARVIQGPRPPRRGAGCPPRL